MQNTWNQVEDNLEQCLQAIHSQGQSIEGCLAAHAEQSRELEPLVRLSVRLLTAQSLQASQDFKASARLRLKNLADASPRRHKARHILPAFFGSFGSKQSTGIPQAKPRQLPFTALAGLLLVVLAALVIGATTASAQALPGDALYPLKRAQESIQLALTFDAGQQAGLHREYANRRLAEAGKLIEKDTTAEINQVLTDYTEHLQHELKALASDSSLTPQKRTDLANDLLQDMAGSEARLAALIKAVPPSVQISVEKALTTSQQTQNRARQIILGQNGNGSLPTPTPTFMNGRICGANDPCLDLTKPVPTSTPTPGASNTGPTSTLNPTRIPATSAQPPSPGIVPNASATLVPTRPPAGTSPTIKVTPIPGETRTPSTGSNDGTIKTRTATLGNILKTLTSQVSP